MGAERREAEQSGEMEQALVGNVTAGVVRVGDTVRRPAGPWTDSVDALLTHLHGVGFEGAPRPLGRDAAGRQVLQYLPGEIGDPAGSYPIAELPAIGQLLAEFHQAVASFVPPPGSVWNGLIPPDRAELICHNDAAPWNLVRSAGGWALIDWDAAAPGSRLWDVAYSAQSMAGLNATRSPGEAGRRLRAFVDGYAPDDELRSALPEMLARRTQAMCDLLRDSAATERQPWARIWTTDGPYWLETAAYLRANTAVWAAHLA